MKWAFKNNQRISLTETTPNMANGATCPLCSTIVIPKCGRIKAWHFAHKSLKDCDIWYEPETIWHLNWKNEFAKEQQEVIVGNHRADIKIGSKVIELQNSSISPQEIEERENFYEKMIWILNGIKFANNLDLRCKGNYFTFRWKFPPKSWWTATKPIYVDLDSLVVRCEQRIKNYKKDLLITNSKLKNYSGHYEYQNYLYDNSFLLEQSITTLQNKIDLSKNNLFLVKKIYTQCPCGGWGIMISKQELINNLKKEETFNG